MNAFNRLFYATYAFVIALALGCNLRAAMSVSTASAVGTDLAGSSSSSSGVTPQTKESSLKDAVTTLSVAEEKAAASSEATPWAFDANDSVIIMGFKEPINRANKINKDIGLLALGDAYWFGFEVAQDPCKAFMCYEEAVRCARETKLQEALSKRNQTSFALGNAYVNGEGLITRDYDLAIFWLRKSIANGYQVNEAQALIDRIEGVDNGENP